MMSKKAIGSKVEIYMKENCLIIRIWGNITAITLNLIMKELIKCKKRQEYKAIGLILDLSNIYYISPEGAVYLVCLFSALMGSKMKEIANPVSFYLRRPPERVLTYLVRIDFFTQMSNKARLLGCEDLVLLEYERMQRSRKKQTWGTFDNRLDKDNSAIVWPMETIPCKNDVIGTQDFELACEYFITNAHTHFKRLFSSSHFNFDRGDKHELFSANGELYKNIFKHSRSWGIGLIHARPNYGTTVCYHDIGIGIKYSVNSSPKVEEEFQSDYDAMKWALKENHSSSDGSGIGLNIVEDFVLSKNGTIEIRSGQCLLYKKPGDQPGEEYWRPKNSPMFLGTQINFFIPSITATIDRESR